MNYREYGNSGWRMSEIGFGGEYLEGKPYETVKACIDAALGAGVNVLDCFMSEPQVRSDLGRALAGRRSEVFIQGHLRSVWKNGQYGRTMDLDETRFFFEDLLERLQTDYIDLGMIHLIDNDADYERVFEGEIYEYAVKLKEKGVIRRIGMSSHNAAVALRAAESGLIEGLLFSINPAYDLVTSEHDVPFRMQNNLFDTIEVNGMDPVRARLYQVCEARGVGITSMKTLGAGILLNERSSPFGRAMTVNQCIHYALTRPGVSSVLLGMQTPEQVVDCLCYESASDEEKDFSGIIGCSPKFHAQGNCVYCNHCLPCPAGINIAQVGKYLDLARIGDTVPPTLYEHYNALEHRASECIACGSCEAACPFGVSVIERMADAAALFEG